MNWLVGQPVVAFDRALAQEGIDREGAAEGQQACLQALEEDLAGEGDRDRAAEDEDDGEGPRGHRTGPAEPARGVPPDLVDEAAAEQDEDEARVREQGQGEAGDGDQDEWGVGEEGSAEPDNRPGDERADRGREPVEEGLQVAGEVGLDVEDREAEHEQEARQHEAEAGEEAAEPAAAQAPEVDAELVRLGTGEDLVDGELALEGLLGDPPLLVDALALDHRDLRRRPAPGQAAEPEKASEDRAERFAALGRESPACKPGIVPGRRRRGPEARLSSP